MENYDLPVLEGYEIYERIGSGGGGDVFKAYHKNLRKNVIVKRIHNVIGNEELLRKEVDILKNLRHSYLPQVFQFEVIDGIGYTVMDYIEGESMGQMLSRGVKFSEKQVLKYAGQLVDAVDYLHSRKPAVIHGDIKPDNIMVTPEDNICLIDFNISGESVNGTAVTYGYTPGYSAPEQYAMYQRIVEQMRRQAEQQAAAEQNRMTTSADQGSTEEDHTEALYGGVQGAEDRTEALYGGVQGAEDRTEALYGGVQGAEDRTEALYGGVQGTVDHTEAIYNGDTGDKTESLYGTSDETEDMYGAGKVVTPAPQVSTELPQGIPIDKRSDVYSIGATLFRLYTGVRVDQSAGMELSANTSEGFVYVLNKALQSNPAYRFQDAGEIKRALLNMHKKNSKYRRLVFGQTLLMLLFLCMGAAGVGMIFLGRDRLAQEKEEQYEDYIEELREAGEAGDEENFADIYEEAVAFRPEDIEAYYQKAQFLYDIHEYEEDIQYIEREIIGNSEFSEQERFAEVYYLLGSCYYELENYEEAANNMANALLYDNGYTKAYIEQSIALARAGQLEQAEKVLEQAIDANAGDDRVFLTRGEIAYAREDYAGAVELLKECIRVSDDDYVTLRAYVRCSQALDGMRPVVEIGGGDNTEARELTEESIQLLTEALSKLPQDYELMLLNRLAIEYLYCYDNLGITEDGDRAMEVYRRIEAMGGAGYKTYQNMFSLSLFKLADYEAAAEVLRLMDEKYPEDYRVTVKHALLEYELQRLREQEERDYTDFVRYYEEGMDLLNDAGGSAGNEQEVGILREEYQELIDKGWIEG